MTSGIRLRFPVEEFTSSAMDQDTDSPRRAVRKRNKPKKYGDFLAHSPTKRKIDMEEMSSEEEISEEYQLKPSALFSNDDVEGQDIFKFKSRHTRLDLQNKVKAAISQSPKVNDSPLNTPSKSLQRGSLASPLVKGTEATPRHVRDIIKKRIIKEMDSDSDVSDFSASSSDFVPEDSDDGTQSSSKNSSENDEEEEKVEVKKPAAKMNIVKNKNARRTKDSEYIVTPDNYFMMHSSKKITTSDHTLSRLKNMNLNEIPDENIHITEEHKTKIAELNQSYEHLFNKWLYILSENFNLVLYGIGSKRSILQRFQAEKLQDFPCVVVNGFFPSLTMKSILETIVIDLLENTNVPSNVGDVVNLIDTQLTENSTELFLIIHNIDGIMLRNGKAQAMLANLAQIHNVHVIATIDHINAPLLWDHSKLSKFKFSWWDVTTFLPYTVETSFENSLLSQRSGALQLSALRSVYNSLTANARGIYRVIINYQLENCKQQHYQGLPLKELYSRCREHFLVSSELGLRAQLAEFIDHKLVKTRRSLDAAELLLIPIDNVLLMQFLEQEETA